METWEKMPALAGAPNPCAHCAPIAATFPMYTVIAVGFGCATVERDGEVVYSEPRDNREECERCGGGGAVEANHGDALHTCPECHGEGAIGDAVIYWTGADAEKAAAEAPDHDWRIVLYAPLHGETYQRHGPERWVLVEKNPGFA